MARDFDALEARRMKFLAVMREGLNDSEIGRRLGVANQTVSRWRKEFGEGGKAALAQAGRAGRKPRLDAQQKKSADPKAAGRARETRLRNAALDL